MSIPATAERLVIPAHVQLIAEYLTDLAWQKGSMVPVVIDRNRMRNLLRSLGDDAKRDRVGDTPCIVISGWGGGGLYVFTDDAPGAK